MSDYSKQWSRVEPNQDSKKFQKAAELMAKLGILFRPCSYANNGTYHDGDIRVTELYDILMDAEKLSKLISIMKMKAFW